jgi:3-deoxy-7-phosphoheptulonate synthase
MVDLSHDNSGKVPEQQAAVAEAVAEQIAGGDQALIGVMLESFLVGGRQEPGPLESLRYGQSITDGCVGWEETVEILDRLAGAVRSRRQGRQSRLPARQAAQRT